MPVQTKLERISTADRSDLRQLEIQVNNLTNTVAAMQNAGVSDAFLGWYGVGANSGAAPMKIGSTDTRVGTAAMVLAVAGVPVIKAADAAGTTTGALGTIPASKWGIVAFDVVAAGTVTFRSGAANYTSGYDTEAAAIAALPARLTVKPTFGYITVLASSSGFVFATDAFAGGSSGTPATTTNYYPAAGVYGATGVNTNSNGTINCGLAASGSPWTGGRNGVLIASTLSRGTTVTLASSAFTYNANGLNNIPKAATTATAIGALGTIPLGKWGLVVALIDGAGTITFMSAPSNYTTGYTTEPQAIADLPQIYPTAGLCFFGYFTVKTNAAAAFIFATDALAGGSGGNVASFTNYYSVPGITLAEGLSSSLIANQFGTVLTSSQY